jgi:hypothetical protein
MMMMNTLSLNHDKSGLTLFLFLMTRLTRKGTPQARSGKVSQPIYVDVLSKINTASPEKRIHLMAQTFKSTVLIVLKMHKKQEEKE